MFFLKLLKLKIIIDVQNFHFLMKGITQNKFSRYVKNLSEKKDVRYNKSNLTLSVMLIF